MNRTVTSNEGTLKNAFRPGDWNRCRSFLIFFGAPFSESREFFKGARVAVAHFTKYETLASLLNEILRSEYQRPKNRHLSDLARIERNRRYSALVEVLVGELYSTLDGVRRVYYGLYSTKGVWEHVPKIQNHSNTKLLRTAAEGLYSDYLPLELVEPLKTAYETWFPTLERWRTEITHGLVGQCTFDESTGRISYILELGNENTIFYEDTIEEINMQVDGNRKLLNGVFDYLYHNLEPVERRFPCGTYKGRTLWRAIVSGDKLDNEMGRCISKAEFEDNRTYRCPNAKTCQACSRTTIEESQALKIKFDLT